MQEYSQRFPREYPLELWQELGLTESTAIEFSKQLYYFVPLGGLRNLDSTVLKYALPSNLREKQTIFMLYHARMLYHVNMWDSTMSGGGGGVSKRVRSAIIGYQNQD